MASLVGFCGSRSLPASSATLVSRVVGSVLAGGRGIAVGCAPGADSLVRSAAPSALVFRASSFGVGRSSFACRSAAVVSAVSSSGPGAGLVGFVSSPCPPGVVPSPSPSRCFSGAGSGSWASLALAAGLGLPVVVLPVGLPASALPSSWGSWSPLAFPGSRSAWAGGFRFAPASPALFGR